MELLYVWIEDYKNIHHQGFNFSPKYRFEFKSTEFETIKDKKGKPKLDKDQKELTSVKAGILKDQMSDKDRENFLLEYFFQPLQDIKNNSDNCKIKNITAIVGENGAGKSNLLEFIRKATNHLLRKDKNKNILRIRKTNFIFLIEDNEGKIYYFCSEGLKLGTNKEYQNGNNIENLIVIYYSNIFSLSDDNKEIVDFDKQSENKIFEVALTPQSYLSAVSSESIELILKKYQSNIVYEYLDFLIALKSEPQKYILPFRPPTKIILEIKESEIDLFSDKNETSESLKAASNAFRDFSKKNIGDSLKIRLKILHTLQILKAKFIPKLKPKIDKHFEEVLFGLLEQLFEENKQEINIESIKPYLKVSDNKSSKNYKNEIFQEYKKFQDLLKDFTSQAIYLESIQSNLEIPINAKILQIIKSKYQLLVFDLFNFSWDIKFSTGEDA